ncbi:LysE family translocator [Thiofilum flexile]|uniref:LysE family translocator n=1 Tax=Thiofilum flexile TaxID=125627 RepID=UPI00036287EF|nr:LysE family translocator [Thiofilum flexile]
MITLDFLLTSLIVVLIPGTGVIYTISTALIHGKVASIYAAFGNTLGIVPHLIATLLGLAAILHTSAVAFQLLKYAGVAYLFYLAYMTWRDKSAFKIDSSVAKDSATKLVVRGLLLNILNPKLSIFFLAFLPQFISADSAAPLTQLVVLSLVFMLMTFVVFVIYGLIANAFRQLVIESVPVQDWLRRGFAAAFVGLGLNLATAEQR